MRDRDNLYNVEIPFPIDQQKRKSSQKKPPSAKRTARPTLRPAGDLIHCTLNFRIEPESSTGATLHIPIERSVIFVGRLVVKSDDASGHEAA